MSSEIMLATPYNPKRLEYPVEVSIKLDGIAADFYKTHNGWVVQSRQGKPFPSAAHIVRWLNDNFDTEVNTHLCGELTVMGVADFKTAGGIIRRKEEDKRIVLNVYDMYIVGLENEPYEQRVDRMNAFLDALRGKTIVSEDTVVWDIIKRVPVVGVVKNENELQQHFKSLDKLLEQSNLFEGFVLRNLRGKYSRYHVNKRSHGMMRYKPKPTVDLEVVGFEEATANKDITFLGEEFVTGEGLRAVGRINVLYKGNVIGVGPGCLTHEQRRDLWTRYTDNGVMDLSGKGFIAEIEYMRDNSYEALRQPIFKRWRPDKTEASEQE